MEEKPRLIAVTFTITDEEQMYLPRCSGFDVVKLNKERYNSEMLYEVDKLLGGREGRVTLLKWQCKERRREGMMFARAEITYSRVAIVEIGE